MAKDDPLDHAHNILRLCKGSTIDESGNPTGASFHLNGHEYLSVNNLDHFVGLSKTDQTARILLALSRKMRIRKSAKLAELNVGTTIQRTLQEIKEHLAITDQLEPEDPSHSGIHYSSVDAEHVEYVATFIAEHLIQGIYPVT